MTTDSNRPHVSPFQAQAELELLQLILDEPMTYPWNPAAPEADSYFAELEQEVLKAGWTSEELMEQGLFFAAQLDQLWSTAPTPARSDLFQRFAEQMPQQLFDRILDRARQVIAQHNTLADQMVACVQGCLPGWDDEDLYVLARPFAYAMRGSEPEALESTLQSVRCTEWEALSSVEQARLTLAVARYAIDQSATDA